ncbi:MAG: MlaE family lipid ABC transporter permease subunit [Planctomycetota bacterium]|nr:MlaE family lipid ABC transporter permease subunit [Planctomycetota bacterium]
MSDAAGTQLPDEGGAVIALEGYLAFEGAGALWEDLHARLGLGGEAAPRAATIDLSRVEGADGGVLALLIQLRDLAKRRGAAVDLVAPNDRVRALLDLYAERMGRPALHPPPCKQGILEQVGSFALRVHEELVAVLEFVGRAARASAAGLARPRSVPWPDVARLLERVGADGLPIVVLISFLIGLIIAFQSAVQLKQFGAEMLVANAVGLSITRELGPLMTAIIVAGRSGASYAAELGTMRVSEEVDALRTLGLDPYRHLVVPRLVALVIAMPLLAILSDLLGVLGGFVVGVGQLGISPVAYVERTRQAIGLWDVGQGLIKSVVFGAAVGMIACERGLSTKGGAEGVGRSTTAAVVTSLFALVVLDAMFTIIFHLYGR